MHMQSKSSLQLNRVATKFPIIWRLNRMKRNSCKCANNYPVLAMDITGVSVIRLNKILQSRQTIVQTLGKQ